MRYNVFIDEKGTWLPFMMGLDRDAAVDLANYMEENIEGTSCCVVIGGIDPNKED